MTHERREPRRLVARIASCALAALLFAQAAPSAQADMVFRTGVPEFSAEELEIIDRNETLAKIVLIDPWAVRRFLDALEDYDEDKGDDISEPESDASDPDIDRMQRASPEAAHDLLQIIKEAAGGGTLRSQPSE